MARPAFQAMLEQRQPVDEKTLRKYFSEDWLMVPAKRT